MTAIYEAVSNIPLIYRVSQFLWPTTSSVAIYHLFQPKTTSLLHAIETASSHSLKSWVPM